MIYKSLKMENFLIRSLHNEPSSPSLLHQHGILLEHAAHLSQSSKNHVRFSNNIMADVLPSCENTITESQI